MKSATWKAIVETLGMITIIASLVFVGLQLRQEQEIAITDTYGAVSEMTIEISMAVGQNMEIWRKGSNGDDLSPDDFGIFQGLYTAVENHHQRMFIRWVRIGPGDPEQIASDFAYAIYVFPGIRNLYVTRGKYEAAKNEARGFETELAGWRLTVDRYLEKFDREQPAKPEELNYLYWDF